MDDLNANYTKLNLSNVDVNEKTLNYAKIAKSFLTGWYWIASCMIIALAIAYFYLRFKEPTYSTSAAVKFEENQSEFTQLLAGTPQFSRVDKLESESYILRSHELLKRALSRLDYPVSYYLKGRVRNSLIYPTKPFPLEILYIDPNKPLPQLQITFNKTNSFRLVELPSQHSSTINCGTIIDLGSVKFKIQKSLHVATNSPYLIRFNSQENLIEQVGRSLTINPASKNSNIILLELKELSPYLATDLMNVILDEYVESDAERKRLAASQTINFINQQLIELSEQVKKSQNDLEKYKQGKNIVDLKTNTEALIGQLSTQQSQRDVVSIQSLAINQLEKQLYQNKKNVTLNLGLEGDTGPLLGSLIIKLNSLITERNKLLQQYNENSTVIQLIDEQITDIRQAALNSVKLVSERNNKTLQYIDKQIGGLQSNLNLLPEAERNLFTLQNSFEIKQKVFSYLSEKKLEAQISRAATVSGVTIVDRAMPVLSPFNPIPQSVYKLALLLGLSGGLGLILIVRLLNPHIYDQAYVESHSSVPILGLIKKFPDYLDDDNKQVLSLYKPKSAFAESVRSVRTNLSFFANDKNCKVICITSEVAGEGKSFISINLSTSLSLIDKKVLLVAADLRRSKLDKTFSSVGKKGLSEYLSHQVMEYSEILQKTEVPDLDFISSGRIPPNPSELLHSTRLQDLILELRSQYDYIIIDTAPVGLISDSVPLIRSVDINIFVIRAGVSKFSAAELPGRITSELKIKNSCIILNAFEPNSLYASYYSIDHSSRQYGNYYYSDYSDKSAYYDNDTPENSWLKRLINWF